MDLENVPDISLSKEKQSALQSQLRAIFEDSNRSHDEWVAKMRKAGYSEKQIDNMLCY